MKLTLLLFAFSFTANAQTSPVQLLPAEGVLPRSHRVIQHSHHDMAQPSKVSIANHPSADLNVGPNSTLHEKLQALYNSSAIPFAGLNLPEGTELYKKLEALYSSSHTPFLREKYLSITPLDTSRFAGCAIASEADQPKTIEPILFLSYRMWKRHGNGPLDPGESTTGIIYLNTTMAYFVTGHFNGSTRELEFESNQMNLRNRSLVIENDASVETVYVDNKIDSVESQKLVGIYLVSKILKTGQPTQYMYCWPQVRGSL